MHEKPVYTVSYEATRDGVAAWVAPERGMLASTVGRTKTEARRNIRMSLADLLDCGDHDFELRDAVDRQSAYSR